MSKLKQYASRSDGWSKYGGTFLRALGAAIALWWPFQLPAAESLTILRLPLGAKFEKMPRVCKASEIGSQTLICFIEKPFRSSTGQLATLNLPDDNLPRWAAYGDHSISMTAAGLVDGIYIRTADDVAMQSIMDSIAARFGQPTRTELINTLIPKAQWSLPNVEISITQWDTRCCDVSFITPEHAARNLAAQKDRDAIERARPVSP